VFICVYLPVPKAKEAALRAVELGNTLALAHATLANVNMCHEWDWTGAEEEFRKAIELSPNYPDARAMYSNYLWLMKRHEEAMVQIQQAQELDPLNAFFPACSGVYLTVAGQYDEAIVQFRKALRMSPDLPFAHWVLSEMYFTKGLHEESLAEEKVYYQSMGDYEVAAALTQGYAQSGYRGAIRSAADLLAERSNKAYVAPSDVALLYVRAGEQAQALVWLEKGLEERDPNLPTIRLYPSFETLRNTPRFQALLRRMNLPQ